MNGTVLSKMAAGKFSFPACSFLLICLLLLVGCLPIPTVPHTLGPRPDKSAIDALKLEVANRADVLLLLGEPHHRLEDDRFLIYEWDVAYGYVIVGGYAQAYPVPVIAPHYLCLEFGPDSHLLRREPLTGSLYAKPDRAIKRCIEGSGKTSETEQR